MKVGDKFPVTLAGHTVTQAVVREVGDGQAVLVIPGVAVTMAVRTELDAPPVREPESEVIIDGVERATAPEGAEAPETQPTAAAEPVASAEQTTVDSATTESTNTEQASEPAPVVETEPVAVVSSDNVETATNDTQA